MVERHWADDIRPPGEGDQPDPVVRPVFDELASHFADRIYAGRLIATDREVLDQHRARNIEHEHDVDAAGFDLSQRFTEPRTGERDDEHREAEEKQSAQKFADA